MTSTFFNFRATVALLLISTAPVLWAANTAPLECSKSDKQTLSILAVGNSLTLHQPLSAIGWKGNWGMAASKAENDYVSQFASRLSAATSCGTAAERVSFASFERGFWLESTMDTRKKIVASAKNANVIMVQLSDNVSDSDFTTYEFERHYASLVKDLAAVAPAASIVCIGPWWEHQGKQDAIIRSCQSVAGTPVSISDLRANVDNRATSMSQNPGVAAHPSDTGMAAIAARIIDTLRAAKKIR